MVYTGSRKWLAGIVMLAIVVAACVACSDFLSQPQDETESIAPQRLTATPRPTPTPVSTATPRPTPTAWVTSTPPTSYTPTPDSSTNINVVEWTTYPTVTGDYLEFAGGIRDEGRPDWTLCFVPDEQGWTWAHFVIYDYPPPPPRPVGLDVLDDGESPIGDILRPPTGDEFYSDLTPDQSVADHWRVDCDTFSIRVAVKPVWGDRFRVGVWGQSTADPTDYALLADDEVR